MIRTIAACLLVISYTNAVSAAFKGSFLSGGSNPQLMYQIEEPGAGQQSSSLDGTTFDNCVPVASNFNFHWAIRDGMFKAAHEGFGEATQYFAFAIVANQSFANRMFGADTVITSFDATTSQPRAEDYFMNQVGQCVSAAGTGVCPDAVIDSQDAGANGVFNVSGYNRDGAHVVSYIRTLNGSGTIDLPIDPEASVQYIFAQGTMTDDGLPMYHGTSRGSISLQLGREPQFQCTPAMDAGASTLSPSLLVAALVFLSALL